MFQAVLWAAEQGITTGVTATTFGTGSAVAYDQMLAFLARAAGAETGGGSWSDAAISWAADNGLTDGLTTGLTGGLTTGLTDGLTTGLTAGLTAG